MKKPPHTERRGGQWWFRRRVPDQLVPIIGRAEFRESLRTSDMEVARTRAAFRDAEIAIEFEKAKAVLRQQRVAPLQLDELTPEEQQYVRDRVRAHVLEEDDAVRMARPDEETREVYESLRAEQYEEVSGGLKTGGVFRKTFITQCRNQGLVSKEITGHADGLTTPMQDRHYLKGPEPFQRKLTHLSKLEMPVKVPMRRSTR